MMSRPRLMFTALLAGGVLLLTGCTTGTSNPVATTPVPVVTSTVAPTVTSAPVTTTPGTIPNPAKYALTSQEFPAALSLLLQVNGKFVEKKSALTGTTYNDACGVVFVSQQFVTTSALLSPEDQQAQSLALIADYEKRVGKATKIAMGTLNTNEQILGTSDKYTVETEVATFDNSKYTGILHTRVFANGTGVGVAFLCRAGSTVPDVDTNVVLNVG